MSTNQKLTNQNPGAASSNRTEKPKRGQLDLSVTQVLGGALAAMTAAALGAQLSVAGTVVGAALVSIITAVAGSLYTASIRRTGGKVKTVFWTKEPNEFDEPTVMEIVSDREGHIEGQRSHLVAPETEPDPRQRRPKLNWKRVVVAALATFGIAAVSLTAFELVTGQALSGGEGTTFQQVREGRSDEGGSDTKKKEPTEKPTKAETTDATAEPTPEASERPSAEATETTTTEKPTPEAQATPSDPAPKPTTSASR